MEEDFSRLIIVSLLASWLWDRVSEALNEAHLEAGPGPEGRHPSLVISQIIITLSVNTDLLAKD